MTTPRHNQRTLTTQLRHLADHLDHHPQLLDTDVYKICERSNGLGRYEGLEINLWGSTHDRDGAADLAAWAATFDGYESHAFRSKGTGHLVGYITGHLGPHLLEVTSDMSPDTETVAGEHGYERWTPEPVLSLGEFQQHVTNGAWSGPVVNRDGTVFAHVDPRVADGRPVGYSTPAARAAHLAEVAGVSQQEAREMVDQDGDHPTGGAE